jgi:hypothetical protein
MSRSLRDRFSEDGFIVIKGALTGSEVSLYIARMKELAAGREAWTQPDGVNRNPEFWPVIFHKSLLAGVREVLGPELRYLPHNDLHLGFSSFSWHRDNVTRDANAGSDWDETKEPYRIARVGLYLQRFDASGFKLGFVRGSHRPQTMLTRKQQRSLRWRTSAPAGILTTFIGINLLGSQAEWIPTEPGDCVIFDPRILHTGSRFHGAKYSIFIAYGLENSHFRNHAHYYLNMRRDLEYSPVHASLASRLAAENLLAQMPPAGPKIEGAWMPSSAFAYVARKLK